MSAVSKQAVANRDKARSNLEASTDRVMIELRKQFSSVHSGVTKMAALQNSVNSAALLVQATRQSVKGGARINLDVLNAQQQLVVAQLPPSWVKAGRKGKVRPNVLPARSARWLTEWRALGQQNPARTTETPSAATVVSRMRR